MAQLRRGNRHPPGGKFQLASATKNDRLLVAHHKYRAITHREKRGRQAAISTRPRERERANNVLRFNPQLGIRRETIGSTVKNASGSAAQCCVRRAARRQLRDTALPPRSTPLLSSPKWTEGGERIRRIDGGRRCGSSPNIWPPRNGTNYELRNGGRKRFSNLCRGVTGRNAGRRGEREGNERWARGAIAEERSDKRERLGLLVLSLLQIRVH